MNETGEQAMTDSEIRLIADDLERINNRIETMDKRISEFIKSAVEIQKVSEQVNSLYTEQTHLKESIKRAWDRIDEMRGSIVDREKIENAIKKINDLELAPAKKTHEIVGKFKSTVFTALCGAAATGIIAFLIWLFGLYMKQ